MEPGLLYYMVGASLSAFTAAALARASSSFVTPIRENDLHKFRVNMKKDIDGHLT